MNAGESPVSESSGDAQEPIAPSIALGTLVSGRYRVASFLGEGAMGAVYRVEDAQTKKPFALKVLHASMSTMREAVVRFEREAIAAGKVAHRNVAGALDFGRMPDGSFFLVLEFVAGRSLRQELDTGPLHPRRAIRIMQGVVAGVAAAHEKGIIHRDLKPENIMLVDEDGDPDFVKVLDFGIAKVSDVRSAGHGNVAQTLTKAGTVIGTPDYMSPEQALGRAVDVRSDLYSLGVVLYELLTGSAPFRGGAATLLRQQVMDAPPPLPEDLIEHGDPLIDELLGKLLAKKPEERYQTAEEVMAVLDNLARALASKGVLADLGWRSGESRASRMLRQVLGFLPRSMVARMSGRRVALAIAALCILISGALYFALRGGDDAPAETSGGGAATESGHVHATPPAATTTTGATTPPAATAPPAVPPTTAHGSSPGPAVERAPPRASPPKSAPAPREREAP
ncbi:MAG: serine/threonine-protein kinase, partial [Polyangiaceae bacterium]